MIPEFMGWRIDSNNTQKASKASLFCARLVKKSQTAAVRVTCDIYQPCSKINNASLIPPLPLF
jgi:hypothetical protein